MAQKQPLPGMGIHDTLHGRQACLEINSFHQGVGQISPPEWLFLCRPLSKRGNKCYICAPFQSLNGVVLEGAGSVMSDQVTRGKLWRVNKSAFICFCQAGDDIALFRLIGDDVHPYGINYCGGPISSRARQLNRDIAEVPRVSKRNVVNVASSKMTAPLIKLGPCSGKGAYQHVYYGPKVPL